ncbi:CBU_0585 family protein [Legionella gresilensis]|uniref:CBU_0585 family protein n=1 Tax=Legionella gresilensis TaxID=91823 RepID=UPI0010416DC6|nr:CBU_0585 family protein [Legionella gresilensis]
MSSSDIDKAYISPYDEFFYEFDEEHKKSHSQMVEIKKNERVARLRDNAEPDPSQNEIWEEF